MNHLQKILWVFDQCCNQEYVCCWLWGLWICMLLVVRFVNMYVAVCEVCEYVCCWLWGLWIGMLLVVRFVNMYVAGCEVCEYVCCWLDFVILLSGMQIMSRFRYHSISKDLYLWPHSCIFSMDVKDSRKVLNKRNELRWNILIWKMKKAVKSAKEQYLSSWVKKLTK